MGEIKNIAFEGEYINLGQLLKKLNLISSGGEAKIFLKKNEVFLNNIREEKRGKKLFRGDTVTIQKITYKLI